MILFQNVVEILDGSVVTLFLQSSFGFKLDNGWWVSGILVAVDNPRGRMVRASQGFGQEALGRCCVALGRKKKVDRSPLGIYSPV